MAIAEVVSTKRERFTILENGRVIREKGKFEPTAHEFDVYKRPILPEKLGNKEIVLVDRWGNELIRLNKACYDWTLECEYVDFKNYMAREEQKKAFKKRIIELRKRYYRQEALRKKEERRKIYRQGLSAARSLISYMINGRERN